jgi:hypothetical protein
MEFSLGWATTLRLPGQNLWPVRVLFCRTLQFLRTEPQWSHTYSCLVQTGFRTLSGYTEGGGRPLQCGGNWSEVGLEPWLQLVEPSLDSCAWCITAAVVHLAQSPTMETAGTAPTGDQLLIGSPRGRYSCHAPEVLSTRAMCGWSQSRMFILLTEHGKATAELN